RQELRRYLERDGSAPLRSPIPLSLPLKKFSRGLALFPFPLRFFLPVISSSHRLASFCNHNLPKDASDPCLPRTTRSNHRSSPSDSAAHPSLLLRVTRPHHLLSTYIRHP